MLRLYSDVPRRATMRYVEALCPCLSARPPRSSVQYVFAYNRKAKNLSEMVRFARRVGVQRRRARWQKLSKT